MGGLAGFGDAPPAARVRDVAWVTHGQVGDTEDHDEPGEGDDAGRVGFRRYGKSKDHLTNEQWARLAPLLPTGKKPGRPPTWSKRQ